MATDSLKGKGIAIYARFSSELQGEHSIEDQVRRCREWVEARGGYVDDALVFSDRAMSGASLDRPAYQRMIRMVTDKPRRIDVIVVEELARLSRASADLFPIQRLLEWEQVPLIGISDGIDTTAEHSALTFGLKSIVADIYLRELRDKTVRGLRGQAHRGLSTGGLPLGYRSIRTDAGSVIEVDPDGAQLVRKIFVMYRDGDSFAVVAKKLNDAGIPPPRRKAGWIHTTVRSILNNRAYTGEWQYGARRWRKVPGTSKRRPMKNAPEQVIHMSRPDLRIVDEALWSSVHERLAAVRRCYSRTPQIDAQGISISGRKTPYLLSGLLVCGVCLGRMQIVGGSGGVMHYRCSNNTKRGTCANRLTVREDVARKSVLAEVRYQLGSPRGVAYARKRIAERLGELAREHGTVSRQHGQRVLALEKQVTQLVDAIAAGGHSKAILERLEKAERELADARRALAIADSMMFAPVDLPSPDRLLELVFDLEARVVGNVAKGRELLRRLFRNGAITLIPQDSGFYIAKSELLPLMLLTMPPETETPPGSSPGGVHIPPLSCAGAIPPMFYELGIELSVKLAA